MFQGPRMLAVSWPGWDGGLDHEQGTGSLITLMINLRLLHFITGKRCQFASILTTTIPKYSELV